LLPRRDGGRTPSLADCVPRHCACACSRSGLLAVLGHVGCIQVRVPPLLFARSWHERNNTQRPSPSSCGAAQPFSQVISDSSAWQMLFSLRERVATRRGTVFIDLVEYPNRFHFSLLADRCHVSQRCLLGSLTLDQIARSRPPALGTPGSGGCRSSLGTRSRRYGRPSLAFLHSFLLAHGCTCCGLLHWHAPTHKSERARPDVVSSFVHLSHALAILVCLLRSSGRTSRGCAFAAQAR
jgi:hypothetical protein